MAASTIVGHTWLDRSAAQLAGVPDRAASPTAPDYMVPEPRDQTTPTLQLPSSLVEQARRIDDAVALQEPITALLGRSTLGTVYADASHAPLADIIRRTADALRQDAHALLTDSDATRIAYRARLGGAAGPVGNYARFAPPVANDADRKFAEFFSRDRFDTPIQLDSPATYAMFRAVAQKDAMDRSKLADVPRPPPPEEVPRKVMLEARLPPRGEQPRCAQGPLCLFRAHPEWGYTGRVFQPAQNGLCVECTLCSYTFLSQAALENAAPPARDLNTFTVLVGAGEYGLHAMLPTEDGGRRTGITGHVPAYNASKRTWMKIPEHLLALYATETTRPTYFLAETDVDFH